MVNKKRLHIALIFGGRSGEHEVSLMSARSVLSVLDPSKYEVTQIGITREGKWLTGDDVLDKFEKEKLDGLEPVIISPDPSEAGIFVLRGKQLEKLAEVDVYFPLLHGTFGEDGTIQGLFEMADVAYVGAGVVGSAVGMDKGIFKDVMRTNHIPSVESVIVLRSEIEKDMNAIIEKAEKVSAYPIFTKPANLGSSVGITKCRTRSDLQEGLMEAALYDRRVLVERGVANVREIEISVLGNDDPRASVPGEVLPSREFYARSCGRAPPAPSRVRRPKCPAARRCYGSARCGSQSHTPRGSGCIAARSPASPSRRRPGARQDRRLLPLTACSRSRSASTQGRCRRRR